MRIEWVDDQHGLDELAGGWETLVPPGELPFLRHGWFAAWWRAFGGGRRLAVATAWDEGELAGVLPLARSGSRLDALANDHTPIFRPVGSAAAVAALVDAAIAGSSILVAPALTAGDPTSLIWDGRARAARRILLAQPYQRQPIVRLPASFEDYRASLDRKFRRDVERRSRRAADELDLSTIVLEPPADPARQLTLGFAAEASGWKGERGSAIRDDPHAERFYRDLAEIYGAEGSLRISALEVDGRYAAFDLSLVGGGRLWLLKGGFDEEFRRFAPGLVLTLAQIERACELGLEAVELLGQSVPWKLRFANDAREQVYVGAYARTPAALGQYAVRRGRPLVRAAYRRLPGRGVR